MIGVIPIDVFNLEVAVFASGDDRLAALRAEGCDPDEHNRAAISSAHLDLTKGGSPRFSMVIKPEATKATWAHECSHMADFICDTLGMPIDIGSTELRAYLVGHIFSHLEDVME